MSLEPKKLLPRLDIKSRINHSPHVVILGAGASRACCPNGDRFGNPLPLMHDFVESLGINDVVAGYGYDPAENFESTYSAIHKSKLAPALEKLNQLIRSYFSRIELPEKPTIYDLLLLSMRPKDYILSFNWDPLLPQAFQRWRKLGKVLPNIIFLHGNVDVGFDQESQRCGFLQDYPSFEPTPLLYPVEQKNYRSNPFIASQWELATAALSDAYFVSVFGYSAPETDVEAKSLFLDAWRKNPTHTLAEFEIIDVRDPEEVKKSWSDFIIKTHGAAFKEMKNSILFRHPRRTCEAFAFATLQQTPWHEDPFQNFQSLSQLEEWIKPMIEEEAGGKFSGDPHH
ncbi:MAG: hypothetical protein JKY20_00320 [Alphaproteobacteria bacterium]|nr:hypothetical protein [Alphaproteobacteria bacterium]